MEIKYFVRTTGERQFDYSPLEYKVILDAKLKGTLSYIDALRLANSYNSVILEDDLVLCKNFQEEIEKVINQYPTTIINFFTLPHTYYTTHFSESFSYNQCTYFPKGMTSEIANNMMKTISGRRNQSYGAVLGFTLREMGICHLIYRPNLVQHIDGKSVFQRTDRFYMRNTIYFKDYLDELGITMDEAFKKENKNKLTKMLEADRSKWYSKL